jgi:integrating conjugative element protein (TIGR03761 family)
VHFLDNRVIKIRENKVVAAVRLLSADVIVVQNNDPPRSVLLHSTSRLLMSSLFRTRLSDADSTASAGNDPIATASYTRASSAEGSADTTLNDLRSALTTPGVLRSDAYLTVQTRQAQRLIEGRHADDDVAAIIGLTRFAALLRPIWNGARTDDPYADWWLVRVDDAIAESEQELLALKAHIERLLKQRSGMTIGVAESIEPLQVPLTFATPYSFRGAYLLALYDEVVRGILTARHVAYVDRDHGERLLDDAGRHVRRAYLAPTGYKFLGINRQDIHLMTARAQQAADEMGAVPQEVVVGVVKAAHAPQATTPRRFALRETMEPAVTEPDSASAEVVTEPDAAPGDGATSAAAA